MKVHKGEKLIKLSLKLIAPIVVIKLVKKMLLLKKPLLYLGSLFFNSCIWT